MRTVTRSMPSACLRPATLQARGIPRRILQSSRNVVTLAQKSLREKSKQAGSKLQKDAEQTGLGQRILGAQLKLQQSVSIPNLLLTSLAVGLTFGTAFQVTHNNGLLPVYDVLPFQVGPFLESGLVPIVLAPIWILYGYLYPLLDEIFSEEASTEEARDRASRLPAVAFTWLSCAAQFILSDVLYLQGLPHWQIYPVMAACTAAIWATSDRSKAGLILGTLLAIGAPLGEAGAVALGLWHYDRPDNPLGVVYWAAFCYASYAYGVGNFARWQVRKQQES